MTLNETKKLSQHICRLLKVSEINFPIGRTPKGNFGLCFSASGDYEMMLDSVPLPTKHILDDDNNIELKRMIDKYLFEDEPESFKMTEYKGDFSSSPKMPHLTIGIDTATGESETWVEDKDGIRVVDKPISHAKSKTNGKKANSKTA